MHALAPVDGALADSLVVAVSVREDLALAEPLAMVHRQLLALGAAALLAVALAWLLGRRLVEQPIASAWPRCSACRSRARSTG
ncbi:hypothetical protein ABXN37_08330 [Piscinibacter sakaiensis]|uniref:hypothetical protein n=1 Tax=Piscinibacter sakaiensis TaxID=1547922 RepID=UPI00372CE699